MFWFSPDLLQKKNLNSCRRERSKTLGKISGGENSPNNSLSPAGGAKTSSLEANWMLFCWCRSHKTRTGSQQPVGPDGHMAVIDMQRSLCRVLTSSCFSLHRANYDGPSVPYPPILVDWLISQDLKQALG